MSIDRKSRIAFLGLALPLLLGGCSGGGEPTASPSAVATTAQGATSTPASAATAAPTAGLAPEAGVSPLGGKPASEAEKEYYAKKKEAEDLALARNYEKAIPIFEELHGQSPDDLDVMFYLMLSHGSTEEAPSKKSKAYGYAGKVVAASPDSREAAKARSYINSANLSLPKDFKYGTDSMFSMGNWVLTDDATYKTSGDIPLHTSMNARIGPTDHATLWETEASPATATGAEKLPKGTQVKVLSIKDFVYSLTSWRKPLKEKPEILDPTMFDASAMYIEVVSEGPLKGKKGWIVNHVDRFQSGEGEDQQWGAWISNRLKVEREADFQTASPAP